MSDRSSSTDRQVIRRRESIKYQRVHESNGHKFVGKFFTQPTFCTYCSEFLWGFRKRGYKCKSCCCVAHNRCYEKILTKCVKSQSDCSNVPTSGRLFIDVPHKFRVKFFVPFVVYCDHCGENLKLQQLKCTSCGYNCHFKCEKNAPRNCGVKEKEISDILSNIAREGRPPDRPPNLNTRVPERDIEALQMNEIQDAERDRAYKKSSRLIKSKLNDQHESYEDHGRITLEHFVICKLIGKGSFGKVFLVASKSTRSFYAMKALKKDILLQDDDLECAMLERDVYKLGSRNPNLTKLHCSFQNAEYLFLLMEFLNGGDLMFHIVESNKFTENRARFYAAEILCGIQFLHSEGIIYRDLKLDNILLDMNGHCKICDFGMCKRLPPDGKAQTFCGTPDYIAPEILRGQLYDFSVDFWSYGVLLYEMIVGAPPFQGSDQDELFRAIQTVEVVYPATMSPPAISCVKQLLDRDPTRRLGMKTSPHGHIREHPFFASINWNKLERCELEPPFKPTVRGNDDVTNFYSVFTDESPRLSRIDSKLLKTIDDEIFKGFSFQDRIINI